MGCWLGCRNFILRYVVQGTYAPCFAIFETFEKLIYCVSYVIYFSGIIRKFLKMTFQTWVPKSSAQFDWGTSDLSKLARTGGVRTRMEKSSILSNSHQVFSQKTRSWLCLHPLTTIARITIRTITRTSHTKKLAGNLGSLFSVCYLFSTQQDEI